MSRLSRLGLLMAIVGIPLSPLAARGGGGHGHYGLGGYHSSYHTSDHVVSGYYRKNGTYVNSYHATNPNGTRNDNYSTRGNINPYTGEPGTKPRDGEGPN